MGRAHESLDARGVFPGLQRFLRAIHRLFRCESESSTSKTRSLADLSNTCLRLSRSLATQPCRNSLPSVKNGTQRRCLSATADLADSPRFRRACRETYAMKTTKYLGTCGGEAVYAAIYTSKPIFTPPKKCHVDQTW